MQEVTNNSSRCDRCLTSNEGIELIEKSISRKYDNHVARQMLISNRGNYLKKSSNNETTVAHTMIQMRLK